MSQQTLFYNLQDPFSRYGLEHFAKKYGLSFSNRPQAADIYVGYSVTGTCNSKAQILLSQAKMNEICYLNIKNKTIPLFKKPLQTSTGRPLGIIMDSNKKYACLSVLDNRITAGFDIFGEIGRILAGQYDDYFLRKDKVGAELRANPIIDILEEALFSALCRIFPDQNPIHHFTWPDNHKFALILTHDVDRVYKTYQYLPSIFQSMMKVRLRDLGYHLNNLLYNRGRNNPYWTFEAICDLENSLEVKSTYYFLNESGKYNPFSLKSRFLYQRPYDIRSQSVRDAIARLIQDGFEIGVHGSYDSFNNLELLKSEKSTLESVSASVVEGVRQHYLNYDNNITPSIHNEIGFGYDTSIGFTPEWGVGFRRGTSFPFWAMLPDFSVAPLLEIPLIIMDGALEFETTIDDCFRMIDQVADYHGVLTILWHTNKLNYHESPTLVDVYKSIIKEAKLRGAWNATAADVYHWIMGVQ